MFIIEAKIALNASNKSTHINTLVPVAAFTLLRVELASPIDSIDDVSWVIGTPRSPVRASLHALTSQPAQF